MTPRLRAAPEALAAILLAVVAMWYGRFAFLHASPPPDYYYLSPAVMVASGQGFRNPLPAKGSALDDFLAHRRETLSISDAVPARSAAPDQFQQSMRYLLLTIGYWWKVVGISWPAVGYVAGAFHVLEVLGAYALFRLFLPLAISFAGALWMCTSTIELSVLPHLRDYSKGAFIVAALPLIVALAFRARSRRALLAAAAGCGVVIGLGIGFKMDVALMAPVALVSLVLFRGSRPWSDLQGKVQAAGVLALTLLLAGGPVLFRLASAGSNGFHVILLGDADAFDASLGIDRSVYGVLPFYNDAYIAMATQAHADSHSPRALVVPSHEYDVAGRTLWLDLLTHFPADAFARALAATNGVLNLVFANPSPSLSQPLPAQAAVVRLHESLHRFRGLGAALAVLLVAAGCITSLRLGMFTALALLVLAGYPSLQFDIRHYFHLQVIPVFALLVLAWLSIAALRSIVRRRQRNSMPPVRTFGARLGAAAAIVMVFTILPLVSLRAYQSRSVEHTLTEYLNAPRARVDAEFVRQANGVWLAQWPDMTGKRSALGPQLSAYYLVEFNADGPPVPIAIRLRYRSAAPFTDFSRILSVSAARGIARLAFPVFGLPGQTELQGIEMGDTARRRLTGVYRTDSGPGGLPIDFRLPTAWQRRTLYQRLAIEARDDRVDDDPEVLCAVGLPCDAAVGYLDHLGSTMLRPLPEAVDRTHAPIVRYTPDGIVTRGMAESESSYLMQLKGSVLPAGGALLAEGHLSSGGLAIGLLRNGAWYGQVIVRRRGPFVAIVPVDTSGTYVPLLTNATLPGQRYNRSTITRIGTVSPAGRG